MPGLVRTKVGMARWAHMSLHNCIRQVGEQIPVGTESDCEIILTITLDNSSVWSSGGFIQPSPLRLYITLICAACQLLRLRRRRSAFRRVPKRRNYAILWPGEYFGVAKTLNLLFLQANRVEVQEWIILQAQLNPKQYCSR